MNEVKTEYKGYTMNVINNIMGDNTGAQKVVGEVKGPAGKIMKAYGATQDEVKAKLKKMVDKYNTTMDAEKLK